MLVAWQASYVFTNVFCTNDWQLLVAWQTGYMFCTNVFCNNDWHLLVFWQVGYGLTNVFIKNDWHSLGACKVVMFSQTFLQEWLTFAHSLQAGYVFTNSRRCDTNIVETTESMWNLYEHKTFLQKKFQYTGAEGEPDSWNTCFQKISSHCPFKIPKIILKLGYKLKLFYCFVIVLLRAVFFAIRAFWLESWCFIRYVCKI